MTWAVWGIGYAAGAMTTFVALVIGYEITAKRQGWAKPQQGKYWVILLPAAIMALWWPLVLLLELGGGMRGRIEKAMTSWREGRGDA